MTDQTPTTAEADDIDRHDEDAATPFVARRRNWRKPVTGLAVAACAALGVTTLVGGGLPSPSSVFPSADALGGDTVQGDLKFSKDPKKVQEMLDAAHGQQATLSGVTYGINDSDGSGHHNGGTDNPGDGTGGGNGGGSTDNPSTPDGDGTDNPGGGDGSGGNGDSTDNPGDGGNDGGTDNPGDDGTGGGTDNPGGSGEGPVSTVVDPVVTDVSGSVSGATGGATDPVTGPVGGIVDDATDVADQIVGGDLGGGKVIGKTLGASALDATGSDAGAEFADGGSPIYDALVAEMG